MKKRILILFFCLILCVAALASCGTNKGDELEEDIRTVYASYVASAEKNGTEPKTYEQWLAEIKGADGANGLTPFIGENGNWWIGDTDTGVYVGESAHKHTFGDYKRFIAMDCSEGLFYRICSECKQVEFYEPTKELEHEYVYMQGNDLLHVVSCKYCQYAGTEMHDFRARSTTATTHTVFCRKCHYTVSDEQHSFDQTGVCEVCGINRGPNPGSGENVYWKETELIFEMSEHSQYGELTAGTRRYYAGDSQGKTDLIDRLVAERNAQAEKYANVSILYVYLPDTANAYAWGSNVQRIFEQTSTYGPGSVDLYCNFAYDMTCSALKGCFANLRSKSYGQGNNFYRFNDKDYVAEGENYFDSNAGEGYFYEYMKSLSLSDDKLYCLASNYCIDLVRSFVVIPVNISLMNSLAPDALPTSEVKYKEGTTNIQHFYDLVWSGHFTYDALAAYSNAVYVNSNTNDTSVDATANFGDRLGFALSQDSGLHAAGLLYSSDVRIMKKAERINAPGKYDIIYPEENPRLVEFAEALRTLVTENASSGIAVIDKSQTGTATSLQGIRNEFAKDKILFGGIIMLGSLEDQVYQNMRTGAGFGIAPIPLYKASTEEDPQEYRTYIHNIARIVAVANLTIKFEQCSAFLDYQSRNSQDTIDTYCNNNLTSAVQGEVSEDNEMMLTFIQNHVGDCFDKTYEDIIGDFNKVVDAQANMRRWHEFIRYKNYAVTNMAVRYKELYDVKQADINKVIEQWNGLL